MLTCETGPSGPVTFGAGEGNRTLVVSLEGFCSTIELHPQYQRVYDTPQSFRLILPFRLILRQPDR